jgi:hypothetical protein
VIVARVLADLVEDFVIGRATEGCGASGDDIATAELFHLERPRSSKLTYTRMERGKVSPSMAFQQGFVMG